MRTSLEARLSALEGAKPKVLRVVRIVGETVEAACARLGIALNDPAVMVIRRVIIDPVRSSHA